MTTKSRPIANFAFLPGANQTRAKTCYSFPRQEAERDQRNGAADTEDGHSRSDRTKVLASCRQY